MEYDFKKVHTSKDLAISTIVLLAGVGLFFVNKGLGKISNTTGGSFGTLFIHIDGDKAQVREALQFLTKQAIQTEVIEHD